ncbi:diguanylate cyclase [Deinococcus wulumuqiensis]|uniref:Diguanylate cyclase n=1 Tax=Deinococcus wulumuqiensis TaxID=980427 RepID=A0A345IF25_9DEIO|nr:diguanylate cyclase [Deinococcus wulumuqiensis]AXG98297.1 diguanylate cyclase [Deinococcus wulumuqiensis]
MLLTLIINFCLLTTMMYLLSLTYKSAEDINATAVHVPRLLLTAVMAIALMLYPAEVAPGVIIDMRAVPIAYLALRKGVWAGLLALIPLLLYRFHLGGAGVWSAVFSAVGVVLLGGLLHRSVDLFAPRLDWRSLWWRLLLVFMPNGILIPVLRGDPAALLTVYLPLLVVTYAGFLVSLGIQRNRYRLLSLIATYERQAHQDVLSALPNRRQFDRDLAQMDAADLLCLIDIDHFKKVNDTFGHAAGDEVLTQLGKLLRSRLRGHDQAYRYGGEEFAVIFRAPGTAAPELLAERLRQAVEQTAFPALGGQPLTVSIGVTRRGSGSLEDCFLVADRALYAAKAAGRNRVQVGSPELL